MSLHITTTSKKYDGYVKHNNRLADPERVKKELEKERRITRLQQVREKSNHLARTIRQEVAKEKERQLQHIEYVKQKELQTWREHVLVKKHQDYRSAIFQVGAAHRAAQAENQLNELHNQQRAVKLQNCRRQVVKRACKQARTHTLDLHKPIMRKDYNAEGRATACTQTTESITELNESRLDGGHIPPGGAGGGYSCCCNKENCVMRNLPSTSGEKRKRGTCCRENPICFCSSSNSSTEDEDTLSDSDEDIAPSNRQLRTTPPIIMDVENEATCAPRNGLDFTDHFMQTNRKFSRVVRPLNDTDDAQFKLPPTKSGKKRFTQISDLLGQRSQSPSKSPSRAMQREQAINPQTEPQQHTSPRRSSKAPPIEASASPSRRSSAQAAPKNATKSPTRASATSPRKSGQKSPTRVPSPIRNKASPTTSPKKKNQTECPRASKRSTKKSTAPTTVKKNAPQPAKVIDAGLKKTAPPPAKVIDAGLKKNPQPAPAKVIDAGLKKTSSAAAELPVVIPETEPPITEPIITIQSASEPTSQQLLPAIPRESQLLDRPIQRQPNQSNASTTTFTVRETLGTATGGRVQFYDYWNKFQKRYDAPDDNVRQICIESSELTAMDHARIENQLRNLRNIEMDKLRHMCDERGQKALEREQVRRDCIELTEKLDALMQQNPQILPSDANFIPSHRYADIAARRETKMNQEMEKMLLRPAIITCPEVNVPVTKSPRDKSKTKLASDDAINVADRGRKCDDIANTSESGCSILLEFVDDQSKQLRSELKTTQNNEAKAEKLKALLERIERIRGDLMNEMKAGSSSIVAGQDVQNFIDTIRKERADILEDKARKLNDRETELNEKEMELERKVREFYKATVTEKGGRKSSATKSRDKDKDKDDLPVEIIIKVRSDGTVKKCIPNHRSRSNKAETRIGPTNQPPTIITGSDERHDSYDSNSTSYRSLPAVLYKDVDKPQQQQQQQQLTVRSAPPLHPIIAHYVQRLLGMTRNSIDDLSVSCSDEPTPPSSIVNNSCNVGCASNTAAAVATAAELMDEGRMRRVQEFIAENRSFITELEDTLRNQSQSNGEHLQHSVQIFEDIWKQRLSSNTSIKGKPKQSQSPAKSETLSSARRSVTIAPEAIKPSSSSGKSSSTKSMQTIKQQQQREQPISGLSSAKSMHGVKQQKEQQQKQAIAGDSRKRIDCCHSQSVKPQTSSDSADPAQQMERYAKLTENCTQRIAELTELISKVREEKQRLVEVTLTSASEGERHSTEYYELPDGGGGAMRSRTVSDRSEMRCSPNSTVTTSEPLQLSDQEMLQKHKPIGTSRDSGICVSRPLTACGAVTEGEPQSLVSSTHSPPGANRRSRPPPPTIRRYSPLIVDEEPIHELSTIAEVDTPAQSHIVSGTTGTQRLEPIPFPTFEQYAAELDLDFSHINADQSFRLKHEFNELVRAIHQHAGDKAVNYREFPSIGAYLHDMSTQLHVDIQDNNTTVAGSPTHIQELVQRMRIANVTIRNFPTRQEYMEECLSRQPPEQRQMIDSASLENLTESPHTNDTTDSFNVEAELRQRRILKASFQRGDASTSLDAHMANSTPRGSTVGKRTTQPNESGIEHLSPSPADTTLSGDLDREMQRLGMHWPTTMRHRQKQADALSSDTSGQETKSPRRPNGGKEAPIDTKKIGRTLSLREFLTRELLKHRRDSSSSTETSDISLKSHLLQSMIESLSPLGTPQTGHGTGATNDRQKTSTPMDSLRSTQEMRTRESMPSCSGVGATTQLFSGESRLSPVPGCSKDATLKP